MPSVRYACMLVGVALRKESVDRNTTATAAAALSLGRSPQGERG